MPLPRIQRGELWLVDLGYLGKVRPCLKGMRNTAQGNALGIAHNITEALKGRRNGPHRRACSHYDLRYLAPTGLRGIWGRFSQGVALGCIMPAFQAGWRVVIPAFQAGWRAAIPTFQVGGVYWWP